MRTFSMLLVLSGVLAVAGDLHAEDESSAADLFRRGVDRFGQEEYEGALELFERSHAVSPVNLVLYNIGMCQRALFRYVESIETFERYLAVGGDDIPTDRRDEVRVLVEEMSALVGSLEITVSPAQAEVLVDDRRVAPEQLERLRLRSGLHTVRARAEGFEEVVREVHVEPQVMTEVMLALPPSERGDEEAVLDVVEAEDAAPLDEPSPLESRRGVHRQWWFWTVIGGVVLATGLGLGLGLGLERDDPMADAEIQWRLP